MTVSKINENNIDLKDEEKNNMSNNNSNNDDDNDDDADSLNNNFTISLNIIQKMTPLGTQN